MHVMTYMTPQLRYCMLTRHTSPSLLTAHLHEAKSGNAMACITSHTVLLLLQTESVLWRTEAYLAKGTLSVGVSPVPRAAEKHYPLAIAPSQSDDTTPGKD